MLVWLDAHAPAVQAIATLVLLGITAWYASLTRTISRAAAAGAEVQRQAALAQRLRFLGVVGLIEHHLVRLPDDRNGAKMRQATLWSENDVAQLLALAPNVSALAVTDAASAALSLRWLAKQVRFVQEQPLGLGVDPERIPERDWAEHLKLARGALVSIDNRETPAELVAQLS